MNEYKVIRKLGQGAFSRVFLVYSKANPSTHRCIKVIPLVSSTDYDRARRELDILRSLPKHSSIIYTYSAFMDEERANVFLVLEYAEHGDLNAYLKQRREQVDKGEATWIPEGQVWGWFLALVDGVSHLHQHKVLHRDIKTKVRPGCNFEKNQLLTRMRRIFSLQRKTSLNWRTLGSPDLWMINWPSHVLEHRSISLQNYVVVSHTPTPLTFGLWVVSL